MPPDDPVDSIGGGGKTMDVVGKGKGREVIVSDGTAAVDDDEGSPEEPPAALESCAKPTEGGLDLNTEYTFF